MFDRFIEIRKHFFQNQSEMATAFNISKQTISDYERGRTFPKTDILEKLATEYNVNLNWLIAGQGNMLLSDNDRVNNNDIIQQQQKKITELQADNDKLQAQLDLLKSIIQSNSNK